MSAQAEALQLGAGPLSFTYWITPMVSVITNVFGDARNNASVTIYNGSVPVWSGAMTQGAPSVVIPYDLMLGTITINKGTGFFLTIPTQMQNGNVVMSGQVTTPPNPPQPFTAQIASWPLSSTAQVAELPVSKSGGSKRGSKKSSGKKR
jgi:hypothetical protein